MSNLTDSQTTTTTTTTTTSGGGTNDESRNHLIQESKLILDLLLSDEQCANVKKQNSEKVLDFFQRNNVTELSDLSRFNVDYLSQRREEFDLLKSSKFLLNLASIADLISKRGASHVLMIKEDCPHDAMGEIREHSVEDEYDDTEFQPSDLPNSLKHVSYFQARVWLRGLFEETHPFLLMNSVESRKIWLEKGALELIDRYPLLVTHQYSVNQEAADSFDITYMYYPFFFFLYGGFGKRIAQHIHSYGPPKKKSSRLSIFLSKAGRIGHNVPSKIIKDVLDFFPNETLQRDRDAPNIPLEILFSLGKSMDELNQIGDQLYKNVNEFGVGESVVTLRREARNLVLDPSRANFIGKFLIPQLHSLDCRPSAWTLDGFAQLLTNISECKQGRLHTLWLSSPSTDVASVDTIGASLRLLFEAKYETLETVGFAQVEPFLGVFNSAESRVWLQGIVKVLTTSRKDWNIQNLTLRSFLLGDRNAVDVLFSLDVIRSLDIQVDGKKFECPWEPTGRKDGIRFERFNLYQVYIIPPCWLAMWQKISQLKRLQNLMFAPGHLMGRGPEWIMGALDAISCLSKLKCVCIGPHPADDTIVDATRPVTALLEHGCLEFLQIEGSFEDDDGIIGCLSYKIKVDTLCQALKENKTLQFLFLRGVALEGTSVSKSFLDVLQEYNNTTIEFADLCDDKYFYSIIPKDSWRRDPHHEFRYESYPEAWQLYYLTSFNRYGRGKVRDKSTTVEELVELLVAVHANIDLESSEEEFYPRILAVADPSKYESSVDYLNQLYTTLRDSPRSWYNAVRRDIESLSLKYGLLRETPCLWCVEAARRFQHPNKRQRIE